MKTFLRALAGAILLSLSFAATANPVDLNSADADTLASAMLGVGPQKAIEIVRYRDQNGPFASLEELSQVKGIGPRTIEQNRERVTVVQPAR
jgi:competence protein ComEA